MPALDGIRGIAILMVLLLHVALGWLAALCTVQNTADMPPTFILPPWLAAIAGAGGYGVTLFFVVSAFTLTTRAGHDRGGFRNYALRRLARVGPGYWLAGLLYTLPIGLAPRLLAPQGVTPSDMAIAALFGSVWQGGPALAVVPGGWSVCCEMAFYLALPILVRAIEGRIWRAVALTGFSVAIAHVYAHHGSGGVARYVNPAEQAPVFLCGVTAAVIAMRIRLWSIRGAVFALLAVAIVGLPMLKIWQWYALPHIVFAVVVSGAVALSAASPPAWLASRPMRRLGQVSYSMYLVHFALLAASLHIAIRLLPALGWQTMLMHFALTVSASFALACVTYAVIEAPMIQWAARLSIRRTAVSPAE